MGPGKTVCLNFCTYYKPGKNEELACRGYTVIERLCGEGRLISLEKSELQCDPGDPGLIVQKLCSACDFLKDGCDFVNDRNAPPCGGFLFLSQLVASDVITIDDI